MNINIKLSSLFDKQKDIINKIRSTPASITKYWVLKTGRQASKSYIAARLALLLSFEKDNQDGYFIMASHGQTKKMFRDFEKFLPPEIITSKNNSSGSRHIDFINGTRLNFHSAKGVDSIVGASGDFGLLDECALYTDDQYGKIRPIFIAKKDAKVFICSTPRGNNHFKKTWQDAIDEDSTFTQSLELSYKDNPYFDVREVENARKTLPIELFNQEYLGLFVDNIYGVFGNYSNVQTINEYDSNINQKLKHYFGIDVSGAGIDSTILTIIDENGKVVLIHKIINTNLILQAKEIVDILIKYTRIAGYIEVNGIGQGLYDIIEITLKNNIYKWSTTNENKQEIVSDLLLNISDKKINIPSPLLCPELDDEMGEYMAIRTATNKIRYTHPIGGHDDYVDSLMFANKAKLNKLSIKKLIININDKKINSYKEMLMNNRRKNKRTNNKIF